MGPRKRLLEFVKGWFRHAVHPLYATLVTTIILVAGGYASFYSAEIRLAFPFAPPPYARFYWQALLFWCLVVLAALLFFVREWALDRRREDAGTDLQQKTENLLNQVRTLPPADFLDLFVALHRKCMLAVRTVAQSPTKDALAGAIRVHLQSIATLAHAFDARPIDVRYGANIMIYVTIASASTQERETISRRLQFCEPDCPIGELEGVLDLVLELSATRESADVDSKLVPLALPIPRQKESAVLADDGSPRSRVLPGAPHAFVYKQPNSFVDTKELYAWCTKFGAFSPEVIKRVRDYFESDAGKNIQSLASVPLPVDDGQAPVAVLNLHRDQAGLLRETEPARHFFAVIEPFCDRIVGILDDYKKVT